MPLSSPPPLSHRVIHPARQAALSITLGLGVVITAIAVASYVLAPYAINLTMLYMVVVTASGLLAGRWYVFISATMASLACLGLSLILRQSPSELLWVLGLQILPIQINAILVNALARAQQKQAERLALLNDVARAISSTIDLDGLLELIYQELSRVVPSDTYFVALYEAQEKVLNIRILYDEGQRYPPSRVPVGDGLGSFVVTHKKPLHIRHFSAEAEKLGFRSVQIGSERLSESWMGVPLMSAEKVLGMLAIAAYEPHKFNDEDQSLLMGIAAQASLALENARAYTEMAEQARRDSLTGALNHGAFLKRLNDEVRQAEASSQPLGLIMVDIDFFKDYNDNYGHLIGDQVLVELVCAIQAHIKRGDAVGRWGGEEFSIILPGANTEQALNVANRIRLTLAGLGIRNPDGTRIPPPTISQGIASYPEHVDNATDLVDVADKALYEAKHGGRDRIRLAEGQKPTLLPPEWIRE